MKELNLRLMQVLRSKTYAVRRCNKLYGSLMFKEVHFYPLRLLSTHYLLLFMFYYIMSSE